MKADTYPLQAPLMILAGWVNRHQQRVIEYLAEENRVLREDLGGKVPRLTDDQRRRLAASRPVNSPSGITKGSEVPSTN